MELFLSFKQQPIIGFNYRTIPQFQAAANGNYRTIPQFQTVNGNYRTTCPFQASNFGTTPMMVQPFFRPLLPGDNYGTSIQNVKLPSYMPHFYEHATFPLNELSRNMHMASNVSPNEPSGLHQENQDTSNLDPAFGSVSELEFGDFTYEEVDDNVPKKRQKKLPEDDNHPCE
jgi:hypothetical protein